MGKIISMENMKIRTKLLIIVMVAIIPMILLNRFIIDHDRKKAVEAQLKANQEYAQAISTAYMNYLNKIWHTEFSIGHSLIRNQSMNSNDMQAYLKECESDDTVISNYAWISPKGVVVSSSNPAQIGTSVLDRDYYKAIANGDEKVVSNLLISKVNRTVAITIARGIRVGGELKGIVMAGVDAKTLGTIMPGSRLGKTSSFGLIDRNGMIVYRDGSPDIPMEKRRIKDDSPAWKALKGEVSISNNYSASIDGIQRLGVNYPISSIGWAAFSTITIEEVFTSLNTEVLINIIIMFLIVLVSLTIASFFIFDLLKPIKILQSAANEIACGDFSARINLDRKDELGQTAMAFNKMAEGIEQYDKLKTQFFSNLSHEFKTPLNVIFAASQLLSAKYDKSDFNEYKSEGKKYMQIIKQNCYRLLRLISNLIDITRYDGGYLKLNLNNYNIVYIVEEITMSVVKYAESKGITIIFDTETEEKVIACDPDFIERIILNLLSNALKFVNENGNIFINIYDKLDSVVISVRDTGIGIPDDKLDTIFERFRQVDSSLSRNNEGSGIGLSLVKALVEAHKGTISVESKLGIGTEFIIELPSNKLEDEGEEITTNNHVIDSNSMVERINIEFSDIYSK